jgi:glycosyltransferase involved in cell wall biosynthesis
MCINSENNPLVSVGIPTYNRASTLVKSIESVLTQTYKNIEIIISDNASTDETKSICEKFCNLDQRIIYIRQKTNLGAANNFNVVLETAKGEYFMWLGDDDWISQDYIYECMNIFRLNLSYTLVAGLPNYYLGEKYLGEGAVINLESSNGCDRLLSYYRQVSDNGVFYGVMRKEQISNIPMRNTMGGDWLIIATLAFLGKVKTLSTVSIHRQTKENDTVEKMAQRLGLSKFQGKHPMLSIAVSAVRDILQNSNYERLNIFKKVYLAIRILSLFFQIHQLPQLKHQINAIIARIIGFIASKTPKSLYPYLRNIYRLVSGFTRAS